MLDERSREQRVVSIPPQRPVGGAIIDDQGREIPITETMIQRACRELETACIHAGKHA